MIHFNLVSVTATASVVNIIVSIWIRKSFVTVTVITTLTVIVTAVVNTNHHYHCCSHTSLSPLLSIQPTSNMFYDRDLYFQALTYIVTAMRWPVLTITICSRQYFNERWWDVHQFQGVCMLMMMNVLTGSTVILWCQPGYIAMMT